MAMKDANKPSLKSLEWMGDSLSRLQACPEDVRKFVGFALFQAQEGKKSASAKPLKGFGGAGVLEVVANHDGDTWRAVYTVKIAGMVYVLHVFQKKSKSGIATPKREIDLIQKRLIEAIKGSAP